MDSYSTSPLWADIIPLPQDDGGPNPLAAIAYTEAYSEAMSYLRAVMAANELSERVLGLTEDIISMNPANYTVWLYRVNVLFELKRDLRAELQWVSEVALQHQKNYQIWHHRQTIMQQLGDPAGETDFIAKMFLKDSKNYHVWSYRQWLVRRFRLWDTELPDIEALLARDVRNNSAWNHRYFVVFGREDGAAVSEEVVEREIAYTHNAIALAPQNPSPWNYLRGVLRRVGRPASSQLGFVLPFAPLDEPSAIRSSHALDFLADVFAEEGRKADAAQALELLATTYDPIRANYWNYRKGLLGLSEAAKA
ncbi:MAG: CAAX geranylgeranyltransferase alpha subunit [Trizodia sp. TS-e1964]|nr:MAG: CAAX geranylgeranyltransferase alpha subunit [Trizodia sp. TS-e1964]